MKKKPYWINYTTGGEILKFGLSAKTCCSKVSLEIGSPWNGKIKEGLPHAKCFKKPCQVFTGYPLISCMSGCNNCDDWARRALDSLLFAPSRTQIFWADVHIKLLRCSPLRLYSPFLKIIRFECSLFLTQLVFDYLFELLLEAPVLLCSEVWRTVGLACRLKLFKLNNIFNRPLPPFDHL